MNRSDFIEVQSDLSRAGLQVEDARYDRRAFGSWYVTIAMAPRMRIVWDGRDRWLYVQRETERMFAGMSVWNDLWIARDAARQTSEQAVAALLAHRAATS
jgi:hypothetical protein